MRVTRSGEGHPGQPEPYLVRKKAPRQIVRESRAAVLPRRQEAATLKRGPGAQMLTGLGLPSALHGEYRLGSELVHGRLQGAALLTRRHDRKATSSRRRTGGLILHAW